MSRYSSNPFDDDDGGGFGGSSSRNSRSAGMGRNGQGGGRRYEDDYRGSSSRGGQSYGDSRGGGMGYGGGGSSSYGRGDYDDGYGRDEPPPMTDEEFRYRKQEAIRRMEDSSFNSLRTLHDTVRMGTETTEELDRQAEALDRVETRLDEIHVGLDKGERNLRKIKSPFGGLKNYFSKRKTVDEVTDPKGYKPPQSSSGGGKSGGSGGGRQQAQAQAASKQAYKSTGSEVVDQNLDQMGRMLDDLKGIGELIGSQLDDSEQQIDRIAYKMDRDDVKLQKLNKGIKKELYK